MDIVNAKIEDNNKNMNTIKEKETKQRLDNNMNNLSNPPKIKVKKKVKIKKKIKIKKRNSIYNSPLNGINSIMTHKSENNNILIKVTEKTKINLLRIQLEYLVLQI